MLGAAAGCAARGPGPRGPAPEGPLHLGWRWVPGARMGWRTVVTREVGPVSFVRAEDWSYVARGLDPSGIVHLEGRLVGFGASVEADGHALDEDRLAAARAQARAATPDEVRVDLRLSGRVVATSLTAFDEALPHRLLGVHFPVDPVLPGERWTDGGLARAFDPLLPLDVDVRVEASTTLVGVEDARGGWRATLSHLTRLQAGALGPAVEIVGRSTWDTQPGALRSRVIEARWRPDTGRPLPVGVLRVTMERLP